MTTAAPQYPFDPTGTATTNLITGERQTISPPDWTDFYFICPTATPFFAKSLVMTLVGTGRQLIEGVDYNPTHRFYDASLQCASPVYGSITFLDKTLSGVIEMNYQTLGGDWTLNSDAIATILANTLMDPRITTWEEVVNLPYQFPPIAHAWDIVDMVGASDIVTALNAMVTALLQSGDQGLATHLADFNNPHHVTAAQVGLGNVQNYPLATTADAISGSSNTLYMTPTLVQTAINQFAIIPLNAHIANTGNPHNVTAAQVGLGSVQNYGLATTPQAQAGVAANVYMTPALTAAAITAQAIAPLNTHLANFNNPHQVSAAQVGLGNVPNYPMATTAMAQAGTDTQSFMSPALVQAALATGAGGNLQAHINDHNNPHEVTAAQVGLGSVANYPIATSAAAAAGTDNASYMTPSLTAAYVGPVVAPLNAHVSDTSNPHGTTAAQVGLGNVQNYAMAQVADATAGTLTTAYMSPYLTSQAITALALAPLTAHTSNTSNPHSVTAAQVGAPTTAAFNTAISNLATEYLGIAAQAADSAKLGGQTLAQVVALATANSQLTLSYPSYAGTASLSWTLLATMSLATPQNTASYPPPLVFEVTGGDGWSGEIAGGADSSVFEIVANAQDGGTVTVVRTAGYMTGPTIGYVYNSVLKTISIYLRSAAKRGVVVMRFYSDSGTSFNGSATVLDAEPSSINYVAVADLSSKARSTRSGAGQVGFGPAYGSTLGTTSVEHDTPIQRVTVIESNETVSTVNALAQTWGAFFANGPRLASYGAESYRASSVLDWSINGSGYPQYTGASTAMMSLMSETQMAGSMTFEVLVSSTSLADMGLGLCASFVDADGQPAMLHVFRDCGALTVDSATLGAYPSRGTFGLFTVGYNLFQNDGAVLEATNTGLTWGDAVADTGRGAAGAYVPQASTTVSTWVATTAEALGTIVLGNGSYWVITTAGTTGSTEPTWPGSPSAGTTVIDGSVTWTLMVVKGWNNKGNVAIKVVITGTTITFSTSDFNQTAGSQTYVATLTLDLTQYTWHPGLAALTRALQNEGVRWGLSTFRVPSCAFAIQKAPDSYKRYIVRSEDGNGNDTSTLNVYDGAAWTATNLSAQTTAKPGRLYWSAFNNRIYHALRDGSLEPVQLTAYTPNGTAILTT